jgi:hypothetical protein
VRILNYKDVVFGVTILWIGLFSNPTFSTECKKGITFKQFHSYGPAQSVDPAIAKFTTEVFQPNHLTSAQLKVLFEKLRFPVHLTYESFIKAYKQLRAEEDEIRRAEGYTADVLGTGARSDGKSIFDDIDLNELYTTEDSRLALRQFALPLLLADMGRRLPVPASDHPWVAWDLGGKLGSSTGVLQDILPVRSRFVLTESSPSILGFWRDVEATFGSGPELRIVEHDGVKDSFWNPNFRKKLGDPILEKPNLVTILGSHQRWNGHVDFARLLDNLKLVLNQNTLVAMEIHHNHWSYFGKNYGRGNLTHSPYYRMMLERGLVPVREITFPELGFSIFLFAYRLDIEHIYETWSAQKFAEANRRVMGPDYEPPKPGPWTYGGSGQ